MAGELVTENVKCERCTGTVAVLVEEAGPRSKKLDLLACVYCNLRWRQMVPREELDAYRARQASKQVLASSVEAERRFASGRFAGMTEREAALDPVGPAYLDMVAKGDVTPGWEE